MPRGMEVDPFNAIIDGESYVWGDMEGVFGRWPSSLMRGMQGAVGPQGQSGAASILQDISAAVVAENGTIIVPASAIISVYELGTTAQQIPTMTTNTAPSGTASGNYDNANAYKAFDNNTGTEWFSNNNTAPHILTYQFPSAVAIGSYAIRSTTNHQPKTWTFQSSNNGTDWTTLDTQTNLTLTADIEYPYYMANVTAYTYYRINVSAGLYADGKYCGFTHLKMNGAAVETLLTETTDYTLTAGSRYGVDTITVTREKTGSAIMAVNYNPPV